MLLLVASSLYRITMWRYYKFLNYTYNCLQHWLRLAIIPFVTTCIFVVPFACTNGVFVLFFCFNHHSSPLYIDLRIYRSRRAVISVRVERNKNCASDEFWEAIPDPFVSSPRRGCSSHGSHMARRTVKSDKEISHDPRARTKRYVATRGLANIRSRGFDAIHVEYDSRRSV